MTSHVVLNTKVSIPRLQQQLQLLKSANAELTQQLAHSQQQQHAQIPIPRHLQLSMSDLYTNTDQQGYSNTATETEPHVQSAANSRETQLQLSAAAVPTSTDEQASSRPVPEEAPPGLAPDTPTRPPVPGPDTKSGLRGNALAGVPETCITAFDTALQIVDSLTNLGADARRVVGDGQRAAAGAFFDQRESAGGAEGSAMPGREIGRARKRLMWLELVYWAVMVSSVLGYFVWEDQMRA